ncbi:MAG: glycosyltransferase [Gemmatimonadota bacterium]
MRIGLVTQHPFPIDREVRARKMAHSLARAGDRIAVFAPRIAGPFEVDGAGEGAVTLHAVPEPGTLARRLPVVGTPTPFDVAWHRALRKAAVELGLEAFLCRDLRLAVPCLAAGRGGRIPVVLDLAENMHAMVRIEGLARRGRVRTALMAGAVGALERRCAAAADHVTVVSETNRRRLVGLGVREDRISVVGNTPLLEDAAGATPEGPGNASRHAAGDAGPPRLVYVGILTPQRGIARVIEALAALREEGVLLRLDVYGDGRDRARLEEITGRRGAADRVTFHGWVDAADIRGIMAAYDVGIIPHDVNAHTNTTVPNKVYDYMAAGLPVLATSMEPVAEILRDGGCGWTADPDPAALAAALRVVAGTDRRELAAMGARGRAAILDRLNWDVDAARLRGILHGLGRTA